MIELYGMGSPNVVKIYIALEELGLPYTVHPVDVFSGKQFDAEFLKLNPMAKVPVITDSDGPSGKPCKLFESGAILLYLAEKFGAFLPAVGAGHAEVLSWLFWQVGSAPYVGGGFGHFYAYAPVKIEYAINRYTMETKRQLDVLDRRLGESEYIAGPDYTIADMAIWPWYGQLALGQQYVGEAFNSAEFLHVESYKNLQRWAHAIRERPAVKRGRMVNRTAGDPSEQLHERHDASDFETKTQDKVGDTEEAPA